MKYKNNRKVGGDYFIIKKSKIGKKTMNEYLSMFNIDDYHIIKKSSTFRFLDESELDKYVGVILFKKLVYSKEYLERWLLYLKINKIDTKFLNKPFPPEYILEKIKVIDEIK